MTNNQLTKEWLQQTIAELESVRDEIPFGIDTNSELELAAFKLALSAMDSEPVAYTDEAELNFVNDMACMWTKGMGINEVPLYRHAQPAPVVPEEMPEHTGPREFGRPQAYVDGWNACRAAMLQAGNSPALTVWYGDMPETNGKTNWTAILHRKGECLSTGITIDRSEYPDRVRYEADRMRYLIGDLEYEPDILEYDSDAHSGYVPPAAAPGNSPVIPDGYVMVPKEPTEEMNKAGWAAMNEHDAINPTYRAMLAAAPQEVKGD